MTDPALGGGEGGRRDVRWQHFYIYFVMIFVFLSFIGVTLIFVFWHHRCYSSQKGLRDIT